MPMTNAGEDSESVDEHVADLERPARHQLLAKLQSYAQQDHGESQHDREGPALDRQERQDGQPGVAAEMQHFLVGRQPPDGADHGRTGGQQRTGDYQKNAEEPQ